MLVYDLIIVVVVVVVVVIVGKRQCWFIVW